MKLARYFSEAVMSIVSNGQEIADADGDVFSGIGREPSTNCIDDLALSSRRPVIPLCLVCSPDISLPR